MHDGDKIDKVATRKLMQYKKKRVVNPFPSGVDFINLATNVAKCFSYGKSINNILKVCEMIESTINKPKVDKNTTRVSAQKRLMKSLLYLNKGLHIYQLQTGYQ